ncbi:unnamed protein product [Orchesella dallaii]|uniref:Uncharacterized protein n=1 Tax=Orchesella dallaii TaxID=48710 RepID=A0ABP1RMV9_9HEXA
MAPTVNISVSEGAQPQQRIVDLKKNGSKHLWACACSKHFFKISPPSGNVQSSKFVKHNPEGLSSVPTSTTAPKRKRVLRPSFLENSDKSTDAPE